MHEDLLGYLLGALEPDEMQRVSDWLRDNPEGQEQLRRIEESLNILEDGFEAVEPPSSDLISRTLDAIPPGPPPIADECPGAAVSLPAASSTLTHDVGVAINRWRPLDSVGSLLAVAVLLALLLPSIAAGRFEARKIACQNQLREFGTVLMQYVSRDQRGRLPRVAETGREAFAGIYYLRLADVGLMENPDNRWCPSTDRNWVDRTISFSRAKTLGNEEPIEFPSVADLPQLSLSELQRVQRVAGGSYAYTLGVVSDEGYESPRFEARPTFAVMADAPIARTVNADLSESLEFGHGGRGINVLYEDGAVRFIRVEALDLLPDHPLFNHAGDVEAGVNIDDASLAPSYRAPFVNSLQR